MWWTLAFYKLVQGGPRLQAWRAILWFEEKFVGRKEKISIAFIRLVCCSNKPNFCCTPNASFDSRVIFKFSVCLFVTQSRDFLLEKRYTTHQQNCKTIFLFLGFGYKVDVRLFPQSADTSWHAGFISHSISCVTFQSLHNWESTFAYCEHGKHISSEKSLKQGQLPISPPSCGHGYPSVFSKLCPWNFHGISLMFSCK